MTACVQSPIIPHHRDHQVKHMVRHECVIFWRISSISFLVKILNSISSSSIALCCLLSRELYFSDSPHLAIHTRLQQNVFFFRHSQIVKLHFSLKELIVIQDFGVNKTLVAIWSPFYGRKTKSRTVLQLQDLTVKCKTIVIREHSIG